MLVAQVREGALPSSQILPFASKPVHACGRTVCLPGGTGPASSLPSLLTMPGPSLVSQLLSAGPSVSNPPGLQMPISCSLPIPPVSLGIGPVLSSRLPAGLRRGRGRECGFRPSCGMGLRFCESALEADCKLWSWPELLPPSWARPAFMPRFYPLPCGSPWSSFLVLARTPSSGHRLWKGPGDTGRQCCQHVASTEGLCSLPARAASVALRSQASPPEA